MTEQNQQSVTGQFEETTGRPLSAGTSPQTISVNCGNIPEELQHHRSWVAWEFGTTDNEKVKKLPVNPQDGWTAKTNDPETWGTYDEAERFSELHELDGIQGIGFVFTKEDPLCGIDLDDCRNPETGEIEQWGRDILQDLNS
jgi:putative DNA primase/helicase